MAATAMPELPSSPSMASQLNMAVAQLVLEYLEGAVARQLQTEEARVRHWVVGVWGRLVEGLDLEALRELARAQRQARAAPGELEQRGPLLVVERMDVQKKRA
eukprot:CAMPEP_0173253654 /NCGR_PEP_ID=MMETSP1142-20121109/21448_1 /TAXON_ID=483371 /ORGANISM="non described non described, Strain CCMP2298" /LENGTH=102 /DNA_ID=CAMNT_0014186923 /DNA_START=68 /DNA_END=375 /DNA_ORIENTATION=+